MHVVTGGAGFIGSNIVAALDERNAEIMVVDTLGAGDKWRNIGKRRITDLVGPAEGLQSMEAMHDRIESVIHMGAISSTFESNVDLIVETNFRYSCRLWDWCSHRRIPFIYASSAATYGDGSQGFADNDCADYLQRLRPLNAYGWSKHLFDRWVCDRVRRGQPIPPCWAGLKFFNVFGPNEYHKGGQRSVALQVFEQIQHGEPVKLFASDHPDYADGEQLRDFVYVDDCVEIVLWFLESPRPSGIYNVGTGIACSFAQLARSVYESSGVAPDIRYVPIPTSLKRNYQYFTQAMIGKLAAAGYKRAPTKLEDGVQRYIADYLSKDDIYR